MKRFKFKFAAVLRVRESREENALRTLGLAQQAYQAELAVKADLLSQLKNSLERREALGIEAIGIDSFQLEQIFITGTKQRIVRQDQAIMRASRTVEKSLRAYLVARKETRMIEGLREKELKDFKKAAAKKEQKDLDELSSMRFGQKKAKQLQDNADGNTRDYTKGKDSA
jgi:flagellar export protein FliJ